MEIQELASALGKPNEALLRKILEDGIDKRGVEMIFNHNLVVAKTSSGEASKISLYCSNTRMIRRFNSYVDTQFQKKEEDLPKQDGNGILVRSPNTVKTWNFLTNGYSDVHLGKGFLLIGLYSFDGKNIQEINNKAKKVASLMRSGQTEIKI